MRLGEGKPLPLFLAARGQRPRAEFPLYHTVRILSIRNLHKLPAAFSPEFVQHYQLTFSAVCGILLGSRGMRDYRPQLQGRPRGGHIGRVSGVA